MIVHDLTASVWETALTFARLLGVTPNGLSLNALILVVGFFVLLVLTGSRARETDDHADRLFAFAFFAATCTYSVVFGDRLTQGLVSVASSGVFRPYLSSFTIVGRACYLLLLAAGTLRVGSSWKLAMQRRVLRVGVVAVVALLIADPVSRLLSAPGGAPLSGTPPRSIHLALHVAQLAIAAGVVGVLAVQCRPLKRALLCSWLLLILAELGLAGQHLTDPVWAIDASLLSQLSFLFHVPGLFLAMALRDRRQMFVAVRQLREQFAGVLVALLNLEEVSNAALRRHSQRHADLAIQVARKLRMSREETDEVYWAALLHDIGKLGIDREVLSVPRPLTADEWVLVRQHPVLGAKVVENIPGLERVGEFIRHHHERWDGTGYPDGLCGSEIPLGSRIIAVVDAFDAMMSRRTYRRPRSLVDGVNEIRQQTARHFDPEVVAAFLSVLEESGVPVVEET